MKKKTLINKQIQKQFQIHFNMRNIIILSLILLNLVSYAQKNKWHTIKLDSADGTQIIGRNHRYYIESIIDKRSDRTNVGYNFYDGKNYPLHLESDSVTLSLQQFLNKIQSKKEGQKAVHAEINCFQLGVYLLSGIPNDGYCYLDIDFYIKNEQGEKKLISHYHGSVISADLKNIPKTHPDRIYYSLRWALKNLNKATGEPIQLEEMNYQKKDYVPQKGLYLSLMEYRRNTPLITQQTFKISKHLLTKYEDDTAFQYEDTMTLKMKFSKDSLNRRFLGYSDGKDFYFTTSGGEYKKEFGRCATKGRYLYLPEVAMPKESATYLPYMGGGLIGGLIVGAANAAINSSTNNVNAKYIIFDTETGELLSFESPNFQAKIPKDNNDALEYKMHKKEEKLIKLVQKMNEIYEK